MVPNFLEITLVPELSLRKATLTVFYDMIQCEQVSTATTNDLKRDILKYLLRFISLHEDHFD